MLARNDPVFQRRIGIGPIPAAFDAEVVRHLIGDGLRGIDQLVEVAASHNASLAANAAVQVYG
jgi:hypothetical protein